MLVPLLGRSVTLGVITLLQAESGRRYSEEDLQLGIDLAGRAALAVENARLFAAVQTELHTRDEFLATASHDLKNPLTSVKIQVQLLRRRAASLESVPATAVIEVAERVDSIVTQAATLVDELLDVARLQLQRPLELERRSMDLVPLVREVVAEFAAVAEQHTFHLEVEGDELSGAWDERRLRRVLDNLLSNAVKYSPAGGEIRIELGRTSLERSFGALLTVRDQGIGIPRAEVPQLFERFRRGSNVIGRIPGTGIGLASVRAIVESHGGTIQLQSEEGQGTCVVVCLPFLEGAVEATP
jgi:signal transduction histidine kinase